jgi:hypothetical protein
MSKDGVGNRSLGVPRGGKYNLSFNGLIIGLL